jgi:hypothetical protein
MFSEGCVVKLRIPVRTYSCSTSAFGEENGKTQMLLPASVSQVPPVTQQSVAEDRSPPRGISDWRTIEEVFRVALW